MAKRKQAVILLSGGLDSATTLFYAKAEGYKTFGLIFDYNQRHKKEVIQARKIARVAKCPHRTIKITLPWKGSALLDKKVPIPKGRKLRNILGKKIPLTYVPARNIIFLSFAASYAESIGAEKIFIGANARDYSGYPDCRQEFFSAFKKVLKKGTKAGVNKMAVAIATPLINKTKAQIIKLGLKFKVPYNLTWSCYRGGRIPCGKCDSCLLREKGFKELKLKDPIYD